MSYFDMFPEIDYNSKGDGKTTALKNLLTRVKLVAKVEENLFNFDYYDVKDGETPELIAHKYYGDVHLHWTILVANDVIDYYEDWPMSTQRFEEFVKEKYDNPEGIHHYEKVQSSGPQTSIDNSHLIECNSTDVGAQAVSNREYEQREQDKISRIKLLNPSFLPVMIEEFERLMNE